MILFVFLVCQWTLQYVGGNFVSFNISSQQHLPASANQNTCKNNWQQKTDWWLNSTEYETYKRIPNIFITHQTPKQNNHTLLFVHIGKTCGSSAWSAITKSGVTGVILHQQPVEGFRIQQYDNVFISIREPIERTISAFNYGKDINRDRVNKTRIDDLKLFYTCFQHVEQYVHALSEDSECGRQARIGDGRYHLNWNSCAYLGGVRDLLEQKKDHVYLIETKTCEEDLQWSYEAVGWSKNWLSKNRMPHLLKKHRSVNSTTLSHHAREKLTKHLEDIGEYDLYRWMKTTFKYHH